jgi:hypothetical protein
MPIPIQIDQRSHKSEISQLPFNYRNTEKYKFIYLNPYLPENYF